MHREGTRQLPNLRWTLSADFESYCFMASGTVYPDRYVCVCVCVCVRLGET